MRISDWSADVCSSDLRRSTFGLIRSAITVPTQIPMRIEMIVLLYTSANVGARELRKRSNAKAVEPSQRTAVASVSHTNGGSEEHTSELQSLMRISYAVFCLKTITPRTTYTQLLYLVH